MPLRIRRYFWLIIKILKYSLIGSLEYRFQTVVRIVRMFIESFTVLFIISTFFQKSQTVAGLSADTVILTYAIFNLIWATLYFFISDNLIDLGDVIRKGDLDFFLIKPVDIQFMISSNQMHPQNIVRMLIGIVIALYAVSSAQISITPLYFIIFTMTAFSSLLIGYSLLLFISIFSFWTFSNEIYELANTSFSMARYPLEIFPKNVVTIMTIIPMIFISTVPSRVLLGHVDYLTFIAPLIAVITFASSRYFLFFALKRYSSASS